MRTDGRARRNETILCGRKGMLPGRRTVGAARAGLPARARTLKAGEVLVPVELAPNVLAMRADGQKLAR
jgi:hypothetical protein